VVRTEHLPFLLEKPHERAAYHAGLAVVDRLIAVSKGVADSHLASGVPGHLVRVVRNGIEDPARAHEVSARALLAIPAEARLVVSVGRLTAQKGYDVLLAAAAEVIRARPDTHLLIVGAGPLAATLDATIGALGLDANVHRLSGWDDVPGLLAEADVTVLASRFEGLPLVGLESMAVGRPVLGTRVCGIDEIVTDGVTGRLVPPDDPGALEDALLELLADPILAARWGAAGRQRYEAAFTASRMTQDTGSVFEELWADRVAQAAGPAPEVPGESVVRLDAQRSAAAR
jgi:glycosyltransferase involved in cell wall biosynthesis